MQAGNAAAARSRDLLSASIDESHKDSWLLVDLSERIVA
jgi:hypothetical protein